MDGLGRTDRDLTALTVLALLSTGPRHTYQMHRMVLATHKDFVTGLPRSVYHAVNRVLRAGLIRVQGASKDPGRPERTVYALTDSGRQALQDRVRRLLARPDPDATLFVAALSFAAVLDTDETTAALRTRKRTLDDLVAELDAGLATAPPALPRLLLLEADFERTRLTAELGFVTRVIEDLRSGRLNRPENLAASDLLPELEVEEP